MAIDYFIDKSYQFVSLAQRRMASTKKLVKLTIVGDGCVGKTYICNMNTGQGEAKSYFPTVFDNYTENVIVDGDLYNVMLWDTAGAEDFDRLRPLSYPETDCFIFCYSISVRYTYENITQKWLPEVKHYCPNTPIILVANKIDLREYPDQDIISTAEGMALKKKIKASAFVECSAVTGQNLQEMFEKAVRSAVRKYPVPHKSARVVSSSCLIL